MKKDELRIDDLEKKLAALRTAVADNDSHLLAVDDSLLNRRAEVDGIASRLTTLETTVAETGLERRGNAIEDTQGSI